MSQSSLRNDKRVVFITPEDLDSLPADSTVYVLSTDKSNDNPVIDSSSSISTSASNSAMCQVSNALTKPDNSFLKNSPSTRIVHSTSAPLLNQVSAYFSPRVPNFPFPPGFLPPPLSHIGNSWIQSPILPSPSFSNYTTFQSPNPLLQPVHPLSYFNPFLPPPVSVDKNGNSNTPITTINQEPVKPTKTDIRTNAVRSRDSPAETGKVSELVRFVSISCTKANEFYEFVPETGCFRATQCMVELEDRFETEVLGRRIRATKNQPERRPPEHRCVSITDESSKRKLSNRKGTQNKPCENNEKGSVDGTSLITSADDFISYRTTATGSYVTDSACDTNSCAKRARLAHFSDGTGPSASTNNVSQETASANPAQKTGGRHRQRRHKSAYALQKSGAIAPSDCEEEGEVRGADSVCQRSLRQQSEVAHKLGHPNRLHPDIWHNEAGEFNDGPACSCKSKYRIGPLHNQYEGEEMVPPCQPESNNRDRLFHYRVIVSPTTNFVQAKPTSIPYQGRNYEFDGFSLLSHYKLNKLLDLYWRGHGVTGGCPIFHVFPRFVHKAATKVSPDTAASDVCYIGEMLPISAVLHHLLEEALKPVIDVMELASISRLSSSEWSNCIGDLRGTLTTYPGKKPAAIRIDQMDRRSLAGGQGPHVLIYPLIVHMTYTPMKLSLTREPKYKCVLKNFMKLQYLMMNKPRITAADRAQVAQLANELEEMEHSGVHRREVTVELSCEGFFRTGLRPDISQFAINLISLMSHLRFHKSLETLEHRIGYTFEDKSLLHNSLVSCGPRLLEYGDKLQLYKAWRKKGLTKMIHVMSFMPKMHEERSNIYGNERLEFLGDAVIEVICSIHLYFMLPDLPEGHLDAYRQAIVQNQHLAELAIRLGIHKFLLYTHSVDFCYDSTFIYARSDAFEALMAAIALDAGLDVVDRIFGAVIFGDEPRTHRVWVSIPPHPLQGQYPNGDRAWATKVPMLKRLPMLESELGIQFKHLRLLARALTIRKTGFNFYTLGDNQRLEFLGDSILKYVSTDYLFRHFPRHHEGHLSLLKNSLVNKYTQAAVCSELGLDQYVIRREDNSTRNSTVSACSSLKSHQEAGDTTDTVSASCQSAATVAQSQNVKYRADLLEAFIGALFVDKDLVWVERFCQVCFWPRLVEFILKQEWNDAKSKLQQCCLTYRSLHEYPEIAHYKVLEQNGPTNQRTYLIGVFFRGERLATGSGRSVQQAQMAAAKNALELHQDTFRQLDFQRSVISRRYRQPYIDKMLNDVQSWDERLVDYFVADVSDDNPPSQKGQDCENSSTSGVRSQFDQLWRPKDLSSKCSGVSEGSDNPSRGTSGYSRSTGYNEASADEGCAMDACKPVFDAMDICSDSESVVNEDAALPDSALPSGTLADLFRQYKIEKT